MYFSSTPPTCPHLDVKGVVERNPFLIRFIIPRFPQRIALISREGVSCAAVLAGKPLVPVLPRG